MPTTTLMPINQLMLDLFNFRTVPQKSEIHAVQTMISISPDRFWALMESLVDDGYLPTENILVLKGENSSNIVKEGNRRVAALKIIHQYIPSKDISIPDYIQEKIDSLSAEWKTANKNVPCAIYEITEESVVDKIVTLAHGKGEKAGKDQWTAVARARHNRNVNKLSEPGLDLLEKYLKEGKNLTPQQSERWSGDYPLTVLDESIKKLSARFGVGSAAELAKNYPSSIQFRDALENILKDIGLALITFPIIRKREDFASQYGLPVSTPTSSNIKSPPQNPSAGTQNGTGGQTQVTEKATDQGVSSENKVVAVATHDPRSVKRELRAFVPRGKNREKIVALRDEALKLKLQDNPIAFCFLLRSMFEISAKVYCDDHKTSDGLSYTKKDGTDKKLVDILREIKDHLAKLAEKEKIKALHGAMTELGKPEGILSVTSMNQLVHNPKFSITVGDIAIVFGNVFPLLKMMNQ